MIVDDSFQVANQKATVPTARGKRRTRLPPNPPRFPANPPRAKAPAKSREELCLKLVSDFPGASYFDDGFPEISFDDCEEFQWEKYNHSFPGAQAERNGYRRHPRSPTLQKDTITRRNLKTRQQVPKKGCDKDQCRGASDKVTKGRKERRSSKDRHPVGRVQQYEDKATRRRSQDPKRRANAVPKRRSKEAIEVSEDRPRLDDNGTVTTVSSSSRDLSLDLSSSERHGVAILPTENEMSRDQAMLLEQALLSAQACSLAAEAAVAMCSKSGSGTQIDTKQLAAQLAAAASAASGAASSLISHKPPCETQEQGSKNSGGSKCG